MKTKVITLEPNWKIEGVLEAQYVKYESPYCNIIIAL